MKNQNKVILCDAISGLPDLPSECAQVVIADPPYNCGKDFGNNFDSMEFSEYLIWCDQWIEQCLRILMDNGTMFIFGFSETLAHIFVRIHANKKWLVWHYLNKNMASNRFWQISHESIACVWKKDRVFNRDEIREPYGDSYKNHNGRKRPSTFGRFCIKGQETTYQLHPNGALPRDVIRIPALSGQVGRAEGLGHPTQKPLELCEKLIRSARQESGIVVAPFAGSGSECVAARNLGLDFVGFEINPDYVTMANGRLARTEATFEEDF